MKFLTKAVHIGQEPDSETGAVIAPVYQTSTYAQTAPGKTKGYDYTRAGNPTFTRFEKALASLEGGQHGIVFSSGLGASTALMMQLRSGDHVVAVDDVYGGTYRLLNQLSVQFDLHVTYVSGDNLSEWQEALQRSTRYFWIESPTNPLLKT